MTYIVAKEPSQPALSVVPVEMIERRIFILRGHKVMIDTNLAELYRVPAFRLNEAVKRNKRRFPADFMFRLTKKEALSLTSHFAMSNGRGGRRTLPYAFTEHGVVMLSSVLNSERAVQMNILIVRAFVKLREMLGTHKDLARKIEDLDRKQKEHGQQLGAVYSIVKQLISPPAKPKRRIGFTPVETKEVR